MDLKELKKLIQLLKKEGVETFEHEGVKLCFSKDAFQSESPLHSDSKPISQPDSFTEDELLYWSTPGVAPEPIDPPEGSH